MIKTITIDNLDDHTSVTLQTQTINSEIQVDSKVLSSRADVFNYAPVTEIRTDNSVQVVSGPKGDKGDKGDVGGTYLYNQSTPASTWNINHNLGYYPNVTVVDSAGDRVIGELEYTDVNNLILTFSGGFSGKAYLS